MRCGPAWPGPQFIQRDSSHSLPAQHKENGKEIMLRASCLSPIPFPSQNKINFPYPHPACIPAFSPLALQNKTIHSFHITIPHAQRPLPCTECLVSLVTGLLYTRFTLHILTSIPDTHCSDIQDHSFTFNINQNEVLPLLRCRFRHLRHG